MGREIRDLIRKMSLANPLWGAPRIHGELLKLGFDVSQATVGRYLPWRPKVPSPTWRSFLYNHLHDTAAVDMFLVVTAKFQLLYALVVLGHERRTVIHFDVTRHPTQGWLARQITEAFPWDTAPCFLLRDRDASYGQIFRDRVQAMAIDEIVTAPRSPWQNAYVERIIGSIRRECLNHVIVFNERRLRRVLSAYFDYHHRSRTHLSLDKDCTSVAQRERVIVPGQPFRRGKLVVACNCLPRMPWCPDLLDGAQIAAADTGLFEYQKLSAEAFVRNPMLWPDGPLSRDRGGAISPPAPAGKSR